MEIIELLKFLWDIIMGLVFIYIVFKVGLAFVDSTIAEKELKEAETNLFIEKRAFERKKRDLIDALIDNLPNLDIDFIIAWGSENEEE